MRLCCAFHEPNADFNWWYFQSFLIRPHQKFAASRTCPIWHPYPAFSREIFLCHLNWDLPKGFGMLGGCPRFFVSAALVAQVWHVPPAGSFTILSHLQGRCRNPPLLGWNFMEPNNRPATVCEKPETSRFKPITLSRKNRFTVKNW